MNESMRCDKMMPAGNGKQLIILEWPNLLSLFLADGGYSAISRLPVCSCGQLFQGKGEHNAELAE